MHSSLFHLDRICFDFQHVIGMSWESPNHLHVEFVNGGQTYDVNGVEDEDVFFNGVVQAWSRYKVHLDETNAYNR